MATTQNIDAVAIPLSPGDWHVNPERSELGFRTRILGLIPVRGRYSRYAGDLHIDTAGNASGSLRIDAETVDTGIKKRDTHLRSKDFFDVERHPHMTFELASLAPNAHGSVTLTGTLQVRDRKLPITTPVSISPTGADGLLINAEFVVDHRNAGFEKRQPGTIRAHATLTLERSN